MRMLPSGDGPERKGGDWGINHILRSCTAFTHDGHVETLHLGAFPTHLNLPPCWEVLLDGLSYILPRDAWLWWEWITKYDEEKGTCIVPE